MIIYNIWKTANLPYRHIWKYAISYMHVIHDTSQRRWYL